MRLNKLQTIARRGFSLIELLVVISIVALLSTLTWLNGPSLLGAGWLRSGSDALYNTLSLARQTAVTNDMPCAFVIRTTGSNAWKEIALFTINVNTSNWIQTAAWKTLPQNIFVDENFLPTWQNTKGLAFIAGSVAAPSPAITQAGSSLQHDQDYLALVFLPDGSMMSSENIALKLIIKRGDAVNSDNAFILLAERAGGRVKMIQPVTH
ncbi:MAG: prepilin-type N-terminal cleavage/methylation domain-containing protein [Verrucomicrobiota bacterium]